MNSETNPPPDKDPPAEVEVTAFLDQDAVIDGAVVEQDMDPNAPIVTRTLEDLVANLAQYRDPAGRPWYRALQQIVTDLAYVNREHVCSISIKDDSLILSVHGAENNYVVSLTADPEGGVFANHLEPSSDS